MDTCSSSQLSQDPCVPLSKRCSLTVDTRYEINRHKKVGVIYSRNELDKYLGEEREEGEDE